jgi:hypothetical protein
METKVCVKCNIEKQISKFRKRKDSKDGLITECKECSYFVWKKYRDNNNEKIKDQKRKEYIDNREKILLRVKNYREENIDIIREKDNDSSKKNYQKDPNKYKIYYEDNKKNILIYKKKWSEKNKEKNKIKKNIYHSLRLKNDIIFRLKCIMRSRLLSFLKTRNITKKNKTFDIVGCSPEFLKEHLEKQFISGMTWENRNEWHIDHIIPLSSAKTEDELYKLCHYTNLQPLWAEDNLKKSNKIFLQTI